MSRFSAVRHFFGKYGFAVSTRLADSLGMKVKSVRLFYLCFFYYHSGGIYNLFDFGFWIRLKDMVYTKRSSVFDL